MDKDLFRKEVIHQKVNRLQGKVLVVPKLSYSMLTLFLLTWTCLVVAWVFTSSFAKKEHVLGWLEPSKGVAHVYPHQGDDENGIVTKLFVKEGDSVVEGDPLLVISEERNLVQGEQLESLILDEYRFRKGLLEQQIERSKQIYEREEKLLADQLSSSIRTLEYLVKKEQILDEHKLLLSKRAESTRKLNQTGLVSSLSLENDAISILELEAQIQALKKEQLDLASTIEQLKSELYLAPKKHANNLDFLSQQISEIKLDEARLFGQQTYMIKASRSGKVSSLQAREGLRPQQNAPLLSIIPPNADLIARLLIPVKSAAFVAPGQQINIRYDAFPYQKFGSFEGQVISVTDNLLLPEQLARAPVATSEPSYLVTASIASQSIQAYDHEFNLKSGMTLSADIKLDKRTLIEWMLEPIVSLKEQI